MVEFSYDAIIDRILSKNRWGNEGALASALGIAPNTWTAYKKGVRSFGLHEVAKICDLLEVSPHWLLFGTESASNGVRGRVEALLLELHTEAKVSMSATAMERTVDRYYAALKAQLIDPNDHDELELRLRLLRKEVAKDIANAQAEPGSGKRSA